MPTALHADTVLMADSGDLLALAGACRREPLFYWEQPARGVAMLAVGALHEIRTAGPERFADASVAARALLDSIAGDPERGACVVGGFAFSDTDPPGREWRDFSAARLVLPPFVWLRRDGRTTLTRIWAAGGERERDERLARLLLGARAARGAAGTPAAAADGNGVQVGGEDARHWGRRVEAVQALVASGAARKVVVARRRELLAAESADPVAILTRARAARPACFTFWIGYGAASFIGSTPELLVRRTGDRVEASALAGSAARGREPAEDERLGRALRACAKNGREHAIVVAAVREALGGVVDGLMAPARPELVRLPEAQHLHTPLRGRLRTPRTVLELGGRLHPTPAVCGDPRASARAVIERDEPDRGWYTGVVGWMDGRGDGELAVALRAALLDGPRIALWAGAGIVDGSDADAELAETEAKLTALFGTVAIPS